MVLVSLQKAQLQEIRGGQKANRGPQAGDKSKGRGQRPGMKQFDNASQVKGPQGGPDIQTPGGPIPIPKRAPGGD